MPRDGYTCGPGDALPEAPPSRRRSQTETWIGTSDLRSGLATDGAGEVGAKPVPKVDDPPPTIPTCRHAEASPERSMSCHRALPVCGLPVRYLRRSITADLRGAKSGTRFGRQSFLD